jgi:hypothetical protein
LTAYCVLDGSAERLRNHHLREIAIQNFTHDRYAEQPPSTWIGRYWLSTTRDATGQYLRGLILDVRPGGVRIQWAPSDGRLASSEWVPTDGGTLARE